MSFQYSIDHVEPADIRTDLLRLWWDNLPVTRESAEAKYQWTYLDAPLRPEGVFVLKAKQEGEDAARIVGTSGVGCRRCPWSIASRIEVSRIRRNSSTCRYFDCRLGLTRP